MVRFENQGGTLSHSGGKQMEHKVEKISGNKVKINFSVAADVFEEAVNKAYKHMRGQINVPGFRKGKAPRKIIESMYGSGIFYEEALESVFPEAYMTAVRENDLTPVGRPDVDVDQMEIGKDLLFSCEVFVMPEVTLGDYKGVSVTRKVREISDEQVNEKLATEQKRVARTMEVVDRPLQNGDKAELDYSGSVDGNLFDGGTAEHQSLVIGSNSFIPGFEEQMIGMQIGEERDLNVKFPEQYHSEELKGKDAVFHVKLHAISCEELPEIDDEFAREVSEFDTLEEYKNSIKADMKKRADEQSEDMAKQNMLDIIVENAELDVPAPMVEDKLDEMVQQMSYRMQQQGFSMEQYMQMLGQSKAQIRDMYREEAKKSLETELVIQEIITKENIEASDEEGDKLIGDYAVAMGQTVEKIKESLSEGQLEYFKERAKVNKVMDMLWENAVVTDAEETVEETPEA